MTDEDFDQFDRYGKLSSIFTPSAPINQRDLFRGRIEQVLDVTSALREPGRHVALYGERGVGKTSLANVLADFLSGPEGTLRVARFNCTTTDGFRSIWRKAFREMRMEVPDEWEERSPDPDDIRWALERLPRSIIVMDEFDRMEDDDAISLMSDTIKSLSDHNIGTKLVIVGVADSLDELVGDHASVQRAIEEVAMPRMTEAEAYEIIDNGLAAVAMTINPSPRRRIARLSEGLPHYVHLLALHAARNAVLENRIEIVHDDIEIAIGKAIDKHTLVSEYQKAVASPYPNNLFTRVLASCALAEKDRLGYFTAGAVREPMSKIMCKTYDIPAFAPHLKGFTEIDRGSVLRKDGVPRRFRYRFRNPLLQPFSILSAIASGEIPDEYQKELFG
jgi:Cdc6-like AAA superfamily ATPase